MVIETRVKKYIIYFVLFVVSIFIAWIVTILLTTTTLEVTTNNQKNSLTLEEMSPERRSIDLGTKPGNFKKRLHTGTYIVTVKYGYASSQQTIILKAGEDKKVTINLNTQVNQSGSLQNITSLGAFNIVADTSSVRFIDRNQTPAKLYTLDSSNSLKGIIPNISFDSISWADTSYGVGRIGSQLLAIDGMSTKDITLPTKLSTFTIAPNHDVYITNGQYLYRGQAANNFKNILSADDGSEIKIVSASNDSVLLSEKFNDSNREGKLITLSKDGNKNEITKQVYEGVWSRSGKYLAITGDTSTVYDAHLKKITDLPINNVGALAWIDDSNIAYADSNLIWKFSVDSRQSAVLATTSNGVGTVSQMTMSQDGKSLYVAVQNPSTSNGYTFYLARYIFNQTITTDPILQKLSLILPNTPATGCTTDYVNFTKPTVVVSSIGSIRQFCIDQTKKYLQGYKIDINTIMIQFIDISIL
jgi:hypothetical protein